MTRARAEMLTILTHSDYSIQELADYIAMSNPCVLGQKLANEITTWLGRS